MERKVIEITSKQKPETFREKKIREKLELLQKLADKFGVSLEKEQQEQVLKT